MPLQVWRLGDLKKLIAHEGVEFLVVVPHGWSRNRNAYRAYVAARKNGAYYRFPMTVRVYRVASGTWVDEMGWMHGKEQTLIGTVAVMR